VTESDYKKQNREVFSRVRIFPRGEEIGMLIETKKKEKEKGSFVRVK